MKKRIFSILLTFLLVFTLTPTEKAAKDIGNTVTLIMMLAIVGAAGLLFFITHLVGMMSTPQEAVHETVIYLTICFLGIPFITAYNIISSIFRGIGDSKSPMYFIAAACAINIILDYLFIGGLHMGAAGAFSFFSYCAIVCCFIPPILCPSSLCDKLCIILNVFNFSPKVSICTNPPSD